MYATRLRGLRGNSFAAVVMLLLEYGLGIWMSLYGHLPGSDHGTNFAAGYGRAIADSPIGLAIDAVLGGVLMLSATTALVRSFLTRRPALITAAGVGFVAITAAALSGIRFVGQDAGSPPHQRPPRSSTKRRARMHSCSYSRLAFQNLSRREAIGPAGLGLDLAPHTPRGIW